MNIPLLLAQIETEDVVRGWTSANSGVRDGLIIFGSLLAVSLLLFFWVSFIRKSRRRSRSRSRHEPAAAAPPAQTGETSRSLFGSGRRRRRRREHRPRNPTLAETGGLPPQRAHDSSSPPD
jgi:hypothetical protein